MTSPFTSWAFAQAAKQSAVAVVVARSSLEINVASSSCVPEEHYRRHVPFVK